jgi:GTP cyclohydrolase I
MDDIGDQHIATSKNTPLTKTAFAISDEQKILRIEEKFADIMEILGLDLTDDSLKGTPRRVAKMYVQEIFSGLNPENKPAATLFENKFGYSEMLVEKDISFDSFCEHHFLPFNGKAHVAYKSAGKVIGLSKINRLVRYFAQRPQVQERLTEQILKGLQEALGTEDVAIVIEASHSCVSIRGVKDHSSSTVTSSFGGAFEIEVVKQEFFGYIASDLK